MKRKQRRAKLRAARAWQKRQRVTHSKSAGAERSQRTTVADESATAIFAALVQMRTEASDDGFTEFSIPLSSEEMVPVARALMRIEAELLIEDAAALVEMEDGWRTESERSADAFALLVHRTCTAMAEQHDHS